MIDEIITNIREYLQENIDKNIIIIKIGKTGIDQFCEEAYSQGCYFNRSVREQLMDKDSKNTFFGLPIEFDEIIPEDWIVIKNG